MLSSLRAGIAAAFLLAWAPPAAASEFIDITRGTNANLGSYTSGATYPNGGSTVTIRDVSFKLAGAASGEADIVQTSFGGTPGDVTFAVAPVSNIATLYTLINTAFGASTGVEAGFIEFLFDGGSRFRYTLTSGINTRDHYGPSSVSGAYGSAIYDANLRFDAQEIVVPQAYRALTLQQVRLFDTAPGDPTGGSPLLAAISYVAAPGAVPEPATWAMMIAGFGLVGGALRRRRRDGAGAPAFA